MRAKAKELWFWVSRAAFCALRKKRIKLEDIRLLICKVQRIELFHDDCFRVTVNSVEKRSVFSLEVGQYIEELAGCQEERGLQLPGLGIKHGLFAIVQVWWIVVDPESIILTMSLSLDAGVLDSTDIEVHRRTYFFSPIYLLLRSNSTLAEVMKSSSAFSFSC